MHHVYILKSITRENWSYVGCTSNFEKRLNDHRYGKVRSTKGNRPLNVVHIETFETLNEARERERYLKSGIGREEKKQILKYSQVVFPLR